MSEEIIDKKKNIGLIKQTVKVTIVIFLILMFFMALRIINTETCGTKTFTDYDGNGMTESVHVLNSADSYVLTNNPYDGYSNIQDYYFCFTSNATASLEAEIISLETSYANIIIPEGYNSQCHKIVFPNNDDKNYIGISCADCDSDDNITFYQGILGSNEEIIYYNNSINTFTEKSFAWNIRGHYSCWQGIKFFSLGYLTLLIMALLIVGLVVGTEKLKEVLYDDW